VTPREEFCLECFDAAHEGVCAVCGVDCRAQRRRRLARGSFRVLTTILALLVFFALIALALIGFSYGLHWLVRVAPPLIVPVMLLALYSRWKKSQALAEELEKERRADP
jgi:hypothetical protein